MAFRNFFFAYNGNKYKEMKHLYENIDLTDIDTIIEPFGGTCAFSYYISQKHPNRFKYVINDSNAFLVKLLNRAKNSHELDEDINSLNEMAEKATSREEYAKLANKKTYLGWLFGNSYFAITPFRFPLERGVMDFNKRFKIDFINFLNNENVSILEGDGVNLKHSPVAIVYVLKLLSILKSVSDGKFMYSACGKSATPEISVFISSFFIFLQSEPTVVVADNWIMRLLFKHSGEGYAKTYQITKRKVTHIIIKNH